MTCQNTTIIGCLSCSSSEVLENGECKSVCQDGYYMHDQRCLECDARCRTCVDSASKCQSCPEKLLLFENACYNRCPEGSFYNQQLYRCERCHGSCRTCRGIEQTDCVSCSAGRAYHINLCLESCPERYFNNSGRCDLCDQKCRSCEGSASNCLECGTNRVSPPSCECAAGRVQNSETCE